MPGAPAFRPVILGSPELRSLTAARKPGANLLQFALLPPRAPTQLPYQTQDLGPGWAVIPRQLRCHLTVESALCVLYRIAGDPGRTVDRGIGSLTTPSSYGGYHFVGLALLLVLAQPGARVVAARDR